MRLKRPTLRHRGEIPNDGRVGRPDHGCALPGRVLIPQGTVCPLTKGNNIDDQPIRALVRCTFMASLDSVKQKIDRSAEHLRSLESEAMRYFSANPGEVVPEEDAKSGRIVMRFVQRIPVPVAIPLIVGDALQNLRSSLDYLVWELVLAANNNPSDKHQFPICDSIEAFEEQLRRHRLDGVTPEAIAEIKALQPCHYGQDKEKAPIRVLETFTNINKHRRILVTVLAAHQARTEFIGTKTGHSVQSSLSPRYHNAEIAVSPEPVLGDMMEVKGKALCLITFNERPAEGHEISELLNHLWHFVNSFVIPKFERFF